MLTKPYTDVRIEIPDISLYDLWPALPGLMSIKICPVACRNREIWLCFGTVDGARPVDKEFIRDEVERITRKQVLEIKIKEE